MDESEVKSNNKTCILEPKHSLKINNPSAAPNTNPKIIRKTDNLSTLNFTDRFKLLLLQKNITQADLARQVGISPYLLNHIITGRLTGRNYRSKICQILGVKVYELWDYKPKYCRTCGRDINEDASIN